jgi:hypothetical protein
LLHVTVGLVTGWSAVKVTVTTLLGYPMVVSELSVMTQKVAVGGGRIVTEQPGMALVLSTVTSLPLWLVLSTYELAVQEMGPAASAEDTVYDTWYVCA